MNEEAKREAVDAWLEMNPDDKPCPVSFGFDAGWQARGRDPNEACAECGTTLTPDKTVTITESFKVCDSCNKDTEEGWQATKQMLREQGIDPDQCNIIERHLARDPKLDEAATDRVWLKLVERCAEAERERDELRVILDNIKPQWVATEDRLPDEAGEYLFRRRVDTVDGRFCEVVMLYESNPRHFYQPGMLGLAKQMYSHWQKIEPPQKEEGQ